MNSRGANLRFRWNNWNIEHVQKHGVSPDEAEYVVCNAKAPWPQRREDDKWLVIGQAPDGAYLQVVFVMDPGGSIFVIHARPLTEREKRRYRRRRRPQ